MADTQEPKKDDEGAKRKLRAGPNVWLLVILLVALAGLLLFSNQNKTSKISYPTFMDEVERDNVLKVRFGKTKVTGVFRDPPQVQEFNEEGELVPKIDRHGEPILYQTNFWYVRDTEIPELTSNAHKALRERGIPWESVEESDSSTILMLLVYLLLPVTLIIFLWFMFRRTRDQIMGGGFLSGFSKSPAERYEPPKVPITFDDVAGLESVKRDLQEVIEFLKDPKKFQRFGAEVPKGVLLLGPPGTGKTLLARAVAGEADVPFYAVNGSEFIQMFVGVGASRVRDLFKTARETAPSIMFIDEIDAVGRQRGAGLGGGHDEREQTLNQILSAMDGFSPNETVIVIGATNRPDVLDPALLRPGRFDRHVTVDRPTMRGRKEIFKVHVRDVPLADDVDLGRLAAGTVGLTGADIRNLVNEAALWATREDKTKVDMEDFEYARDKVLMGAKREEVMLEKEKEKTAYHEAGHALLGWLLPGVDRIHKVTVIPRGRSLGVTQTLPEEDKLNVAESELHDRLAFLLGGRAAEKLVFGEFSAGAENDLERATQLVRRMVTQWGMSERLGPVNYKITDSDPFLGREMHEQRKFSEHMLQVIDEEISKILHDTAKRALQLLADNRDSLTKLAEALIEQEEISDKEIGELIGPSVHELKKNSAGGKGELAAQQSVRKTRMRDDEI